MFSEPLAERIAVEFQRKNVAFEEKRMFGGIAFMVDDKMCVGVMKDSMMLRIDPKQQPDLLTKEGCREMDFTKRPMKGMVYVDSWAIENEQDLSNWIQIALDFNPKAKSSKKRKK
jgi:TfoX/Sxy family transcriptional regulator of competence genes